MNSCIFFKTIATLRFWYQEGLSCRTNYRYNWAVKIWQILANHWPCQLLQDQEWGWTSICIKIWRRALIALLKIAQQFCLANTLYREKCLEALLCKKSVDRLCMLCTALNFSICLLSPFFTTLRVLAKMQLQCSAPNKDFLAACAFLRVAIFPLWKSWHLDVLRRKKYSAKNLSAKATPCSGVQWAEACQWKCFCKHCT